jgi:hypothetical protein
VNSAITGLAPSHCLANAQVSCEQWSEEPVLVSLHLIVERPRSPTRGRSSVAGYYAPLTREEGRHESAPWRVGPGLRIIDMPLEEGCGRSSGVESEDREKRAQTGPLDQRVSRCGIHAATAIGEPRGG